MQAMGWGIIFAVGAMLSCGGVGLLILWLATR
jgi:hypothetical protein